MSVPMKKPLTNIKIDDQIFYISKDEKKAILTLLNGVSENCENPFEALEKLLPASAIKLRGARKRLGLSQLDLSKQTGISASNISKIENGERGIGIITAKKLSKALKISYKVFLKK